MKSKSFKLLVKVSKNRRWLGTVGKIITYPPGIKGKPRRGAGVLSFCLCFLSKKGEVFSRVGGGPVENSFCNPREPDYLCVTGLAVQRSQQKVSTVARGTIQILG